jgi:hypothetical protein
MQKIDRELAKYPADQSVGCRGRAGPCPDELGWLAPETMKLNWPNCTCRRLPQRCSHITGQRQPASTKITVCTNSRPVGMRARCRVPEAEINDFRETTADGSVHPG